MVGLDAQVEYNVISWGVLEFRKCFLSKGKSFLGWEIDGSAKCWKQLAGRAHLVVLCGEHSSQFALVFIIK